MTVASTFAVWRHRKADHRGLAIATAFDSVGKAWRLGVAMDGTHAS